MLAELKQGGPGSGVDEAGAPSVGSPLSGDSVSYVDVRSAVNDEEGDRIEALEVEACARPA